MKIKFGSIVTEGRGKLGGQVYSRNRSGAYVRSKVTPSNPQTARQSVIRSFLAQLSTGWRNLTEAQRDAWRGAVDNWKRTDIFGDTVTPTGKNLYTQLGVVMLNIGETPLNTPPVPEAIVEPEIATLSLDIGSGTFDIELSSVETNQSYVVLATAPQSPGAAYFKNKYRQIEVFDGGSGTTLDIDSSYQAKFGAPLEGQKIGVKVVPVITETGQQGVGVTDAGFVTDTP